MKIAILKERTLHEARVAATPDSVKKLVALGFSVCVEAAAGAGASIPDAGFELAGATIGKDPATTCEGASLVLTVQPPEQEALAAIPAHAMLIGMLSPYGAADRIQTYADRNITAFALEFLPRISRAQSMDTLSSQSNLAGYRAVIDAVSALSKAVPMMMTAAGTVTPAKALILGAGVAGLQAIATAKRLGAVVSAFDVRPAVKEQVQSLGAKFIEVPAEETAETAGGYAKEMSEEYKRKQSQLIHDSIKAQDIVITTSLIPGRPAPVLITQEMVEDMKDGSVIVDLAVAAGGNCPLSRPDKIVTHKGVTIIGHTNMPGRVARDASPLYARNLYNFIENLFDRKDGQFTPRWDDELVQGTLLTKDGAVVHPQLAKKAA